jgi:amidophosphoribosyltransferase
MDFPTPKELIANQLGGDVQKIGDHLGVDSLEYLSIDDLLASVPKENGADYCTACFSGKYPIPVDENHVKDENEA